MAKVEGKSWEDRLFEIGLRDYRKDLLRRLEAVGDSDDAYRVEEPYRSLQLEAAKEIRRLIKMCREAVDKLEEHTE